MRPGTSHERNNRALETDAINAPRPVLILRSNGAGIPSPYKRVCTVPRSGPKPAQSGRGGRPGALPRSSARYAANLAIVAWCTPIVFAIALQLSPAARRLSASPCW